ncbi:MAG TPA: hypothetical protein VFF27_02630 [Bacteroidia bacterium]|jgi:hypothetical protein|nr:hypothetical protein [Bacteroidia bacterium]
MVRRIVGYFIYALGFLTITFFKDYAGTVIPYPFVFWLIGIACFIIGSILIRSIPSVKQQKSDEQLQKRIQELKNTGERITVNLNDCDIKEHNYTEEQERKSSFNDLASPSLKRDIQAWDALFDSSRNVNNVTVNQTILIYTHRSENKAEKFYSSVIPKDRISLMFKLDAQKTTTLYIDKQNRENYYFDLDFLND